MVNISLRDKETWHDQRPSHRKVSSVVMAAQEHARIARQQYDEYIERMLASGDINWTEREYLEYRADEADKALLDARDCQHLHTSMTGVMTFSAGEVDDNIVTVCEDCGKEVTE